MKQALVVGCGLSGSVIARELAENGYKVTILERRNHIGGNMYDHVDEHGILVHNYGPHTFHTKEKKLYDYMCKYAQWDEYHLKCGAVINHICTPTPFNYKTIDDFYSKEEAEQIKKEIEKTFPRQSTATVVEALTCDNEIVRNYAQFLFDNDYSLYSAKQWGVSPSEIDPSILKRVPLRFDYKDTYFDDTYQFMPHESFTSFFVQLLDHPNIEVQLNTSALDHISVQNDKVLVDGQEADYPVIYTGALDELFDTCYGDLPYRSLKFVWKHEDKDSFQDMAVVAYPQEKDFVRIIEYKKLPMQEVKGTTYEVEYALPYKAGEKNEPYYPLLTDDSNKLYSMYQEKAKHVQHLHLCGRLANFKYYNMDQALEAALLVAEEIIDCNE